MGGGSGLSVIFGCFLWVIWTLVFFSSIWSFPLIGFGNARFRLMAAGWDGVSLYSCKIDVKFVFKFAFVG